MRNILVYPYKRFEDIGAVTYDKQTHEIRFEPSVWSTLSKEEKAEIVSVCNSKLEDYFAAL